MPIYEYVCRSCDATTEKFRSVAERNEPVDCHVCGGVTRKIISLPRVHPDFEPYYDDNLQTPIKSKQHRKKVMQEQGVSEAHGKGWM